MVKYKIKQAQDIKLQTQMYSCFTVLPLHTSRPQRHRQINTFVQACNIVQLNNHLCFAKMMLK